MKLTLWLTQPIKSLESAVGWSLHLSWLEEKNVHACHVPVCQWEEAMPYFGAPTPFWSTRPIWKSAGCSYSLLYILGELTVNHLTGFYYSIFTVFLPLQSRSFFTVYTLYIYIYIYIYISGGPLSALTCCVNARLLSAIKKISPLIYSQSWVGSWVYTTQAMMTFTLIF